MKTIHHALIALIAVAALGGGLMTHSAQAQAATSANIAVVDVNEVLKNLQEAQAIQAELQQQALQLQKEAEEREKEIKKIQADLEILMPGSDTYQEKQQGLEQKAVEFRVWREYNQRRLERQNVVQLAALYKKITAEVESVAKSGGYDLVLFKDSFNLPASANRQQLTTIIQMRKVLYSSDKIELTQNVIQRMNNAWKNR